MRWPDGRSEGTCRDDRPVPRCGSGRCIEHLAMRPCKMRLLLFPEAVARSTDDVGHLKGGPAHLLIFLLERFTSSGLDTSMASSGLGIACRWRRDKCR